MFLALVLECISSRSSAIKPPSHKYSLCVPGHHVVNDFFSNGINLQRHLREKDLKFSSRKKFNFTAHTQYLPIYTIKLKNQEGTYPTEQNKFLLRIDFSYCSIMRVFYFSLREFSYWLHSLAKGIFLPFIGSFSIPFRDHVLARDSGVNFPHQQTEHGQSTKFVFLTLSCVGSHKQLIFS